MGTQTPAVTQWVFRCLSSGMPQFPLSCCGAGRAAGQGANPLRAPLGESQGAGGTARVPGDGGGCDSLTLVQRRLVLHLVYQKSKQLV